MAETLKKIDGIYHAALPTKRGKKWISTGADTKTEAEAVVSKSGVHQLSIAAKAGNLSRRAIGQILTGKNLTCRAALDSMIKIKSASRSRNTMSNTMGVVSRWLEEAGIENAPPSSIESSQIHAWINDPKSKRNRNTRLFTLSCIKSFFEFCNNQGWIVGNPANLVEVDHSILTHDQKEASQRQPFTEDELDRVIKSLREDWQRAKRGKHELFREAADVLFWFTAVLISSETGLRISDIATLQWRSFSEPNKIVVWTQKTDARIEHVISKELQDLIGEIPVEDPEYVFPDRRTCIEDVKRRSQLSMSFIRLLGRLGISGKSFHSIRHYRATKSYHDMDKMDLAKKLASVLTLQEIANLLGHAETNTTKRYIKKQKEDE